MARSALLALLLLSLPAAASSTAVAVMPFRDLSGSDRSVGDAIRESVTTDLRGVAGITVVERGEIDRVLAEQKVQGAEIDKDPLATLRIGKLIGADLITVGAYQQVGRRVRLTARFVRTKTGEVVGTAKVDGDVGDFLGLQDKVTVELLRSAKLGAQVIERFARRPPRPKLRSIRPVELYGQSVKEKDEPMRRALLREAVKEAPAYDHAKDALSQLEQKLREYDARMAAARKVETDKVAARWEAAATPMEKFQLSFSYAQLLGEHRRLHALRRMWDALAKELEASPNPDESRYAPIAWQQSVLVLDRMGLGDELLEAGQRMVERYPEAPEFAAVKSAMERAIARKQKGESGREELEKELAGIRNEARWDLCTLGYKYRSAGALVEARRLFYACYEAGTGDPARTLSDLVYLSIELGDQAAARRYFALLEDTSPTAHLAARAGIEFRLAVDE